MALHESGEDYLEAVLVLRQERGDRPFPLT